MKGARISVLWDDDRWYAARVNGCDVRKHEIGFDDGSIATLLLVGKNPTRPWKISCQSKEHLLSLMLEYELDPPRKDQIEQWALDQVFVRNLPISTATVPPTHIIGRERGMESHPQAPLSGPSTLTHHVNSELL